MLVLLMTAVTGAWASDDLSNKIWKPGDTFNIGEAWFYNDDQNGENYYQASGNDCTIPQLSDWHDVFEQWEIIEFINCQNSNNGPIHGLYNLRMTPPEGKQIPDIKPDGFKIISGAGTQESPYRFGLVYDETVTPTGLYLEVDGNGTSATLKYDAAFSTASGKPCYGEYQGSMGWVSIGEGKSNIATVTVDASCKNFNGTILFLLFGSWSALTTINDLGNLNTANVTGMQYMFAGCSALTTLDLSSWNTANATNMEGLFSGCSNLTTLDLSSWNTANVTNMAGIFYSCQNLTTIYVGDGWSTDKVTASEDMFTYCSKLPNWDENVTDATKAHTGEGGYLTNKASGTVSPATYSVALKEGTEDATNWQGKAGTGDYQALPLTGLEAGTAVSVKYSGTKHVKSVKAKKKEAPATGTDLSMVDCAGTARTDGQWTANCYMVHTAGDYKLPLVYGNSIKAGATNAAAYTGVENANTTLTFPRHDGEAITAPWIKDNNITVTSAELLWQDADGLITKVGISGDYLTLTVGTDAATQEGNALVAAKDGEGNVVWSWHIWVTKQTFAAADLTTVDTGEGGHVYTVTPVNLGWVGDDIYTGTNTFYQWGRKDPFKGTGTVTFDGSTPATIADNIKNPATFYNVSSKPSNTAYYNMWDAQQTGTDEIATATVKTVYDPSPAGFCVPTGNLYYYMKNGSGVSFGWDDTNKGRNLTSVTPNVFFPASGYRNGSGGGLNSVGSYGYSWSASAFGSNTSYARYLFFSPTSWNFSNYNRSYGYPVWAVAEE